MTIQLPFIDGCQPTKFQAQGVRLLTALQFDDHFVPIVRKSISEAVFCALGHPQQRAQSAEAEHRLLERQLLPVVEDAHRPRGKSPLAGWVPIPLPRRPTMPYRPPADLIGREAPDLPVPELP